MGQQATQIGHLSRRVSQNAQPDDGDNNARVVGVLRTTTGWPPLEAIQLGLYLGALLEEPLLAPRPEQGGDRSFGPAWRGGPMGGAAL